MAKGIITIQDTEDGTVSLDLEFEPPLSDDKMASNAQHAAFILFKSFPKAMEDLADLERVE